MNRRGVALVTVLLVAAALLAIVSVGLKLGSDGVLFSSQAHKRNVAIGAAEAGVYQAMQRIQENKGFYGSANGTLASSGGEFVVSVENRLATDGVYRVTSTGTFGNVKRTLQVELEPDSSEYRALSLGGKVYVYERVFCNGITGVDERLVRPGNIHSQYASGATFLGREYERTGSLVAPHLHATGDLTTASSSLKSNLETTAAGERTSQSHNPYRLDDERMRPSSYSTSMPSGNVVASNVRLSGNRVFNSPVVVEKGATLHIQGYAEFRGGLSGEGQVVVDQDVVVVANHRFDSSVKSGIKLHSDEAVLLIHPEVTIDDEGFEVPRNQDSRVGDYFASMPMQAVQELPASLPLDAPAGAEFFRWFKSNDQAGGSQEFRLWLDGDGSNVYPGLSQETKEWLRASNPGLIENWAAQNP